MPTRSFLPALALGLALVVAACGASSSATSSSSRAASAIVSAAATSTTSSAAESPAASPASSTGAVACTSPATPTMAETEGPYYKAGAPENADLVQAGMAGTPLALTGYVVSADCTPLANARVEIWQADSAGNYDNSGYTLRGYVLTDAAGRFSIRTIVPGEYPGRTEHIHVKITPDGGSTLTTQVYFPGTTANDADGIYDPSLLLTMSGGASDLAGTYTFVIGG